MKRIAQNLAWLGLVVFWAIILIEDVRENLGFSEVPSLYEAEVIGYVSSSPKTRSPIARIKFGDGSVVKFTSQKSGRHEMFAVGESVKLVQKMTNRTIYEIDYFPHRYGYTVISSIVLCICLVIFAISLVATKPFPRKPNDTSFKEARWKRLR